jgi:hypothetical protein
MTAEPAENRDETAAPLALRGRPFLPGNSANPGGRPKGLAALVREQTKDGQELVRFMLGVLRGRKTPLRYRLEAAAWLADRGFGKVSQPLTGEGGGPLRFTLVLSAAGAPVEEGVEEGADGDGGG